jgi:uncharacterized protein (TIGR02757 family)
MTHLKPFLERLYTTYHTLDSVRQDPLSFPRRYNDVLDIEVAAVIASSFAFGRVAAFMPVIDRILTRLGDHPGQAVCDASQADLKQVSAGIIYRFVRPENVVALLANTGAALRENGSLEHALLRGFNTGGTASGLLELAATLRRSDLDPGFLVPVGNTDSPMKRLVLMLRWMVRDDGIDFGLWKGIKPSDLLFPLDVHVFRISGLLGLIPSAAPGRHGADAKPAAPRMKDSILLTDRLRKLDPDDPVRYDFALSHLGISGNCKGVPCGLCLTCPLHTVCLVPRN